MSIIATIAMLVLGWLHWSGWWAIPLDLLSFFGAHRALPSEGYRINRIGLPLYILGSFLLMKFAGWIQTSLT